MPIDQTTNPSHLGWALAQRLLGGWLRDATRNILGRGPTYILLCTGFVVAGCQTTPESELPTLAEIAPSEGRWQVNDDQAREDALARDWRAEFMIGELAVALDEPTTAAWGMIEPQWLDPRVLRLWLANGLAAGTLPNDRWRSFEARLPPVLSRGARRVRAAGDWQVLAETPVRRSDTAIPVVLAQTQGVVERTREIDRGVVRLMAQVRPAIDGGLFVGLWLQQHIPDRLGVVKQADGTVRPMTLDEKFEAGWFMTELVQEVAVPRGQVLVVGLHRPWGFIPTQPLTPDAWPAAVAGLGVVCSPLFTEHYVMPDRVFQKIDVPPLERQLGSALLVPLTQREPAQKLFLIGPLLP